MNVSHGDLAALVKPIFRENCDRICTVVRRAPEAEAIEGYGTWWRCHFPRPVRTTGGMQHWACIEDSCLRRIAGPSVLSKDEFNASEPKPVFLIIE